MNHEQLARQYPAYIGFPYGVIVEHKESGETARVIGYTNYAKGEVKLEVPISGKREYPVSDLRPVD